MKFMKALAIIVLIAIVATLCLDAVDIINIKDKIDNLLPEQGGEDPVARVDDEDIMGGEVYAMARNMVYTMSNETSSVVPMSAPMSTAINLVATITPSYASDQSVTWSVAWVDGDSQIAYAEPPTDYITAVPTANGSKTATVTCLKPFPEQIKITVTSNDNADAKAECIVDYQKQLVDFDIEIQDVSTSLAGCLEWDTAYRGKVVNVETTEGTLDYEYEERFDLEYTLNSTIMHTLYDNQLGNFDGSYTLDPANSFGVNFARLIFDGNPSDTELADLKQALYLCSDLSLTFSKTIDGITATKSLSINRNSIHIIVEEITLDKTTITF